MLPWRVVVGVAACILVVLSFAVISRPSTTQRPAVPLGIDVNESFAVVAATSTAPTSTTPSARELSVSTPGDLGVTTPVTTEPAATVPTVTAAAVPATGACTEAATAVLRCHRFEAAVLGAPAPRAKVANSFYTAFPGLPRFDDCGDANCTQKRCAAAGTFATSTAVASGDDSERVSNVPLLRIPELMEANVASKAEQIASLPGGSSRLSWLGSHDCFSVFTDADIGADGSLLLRSKRKSASSRPRLCNEAGSVASSVSMQASGSQHDGADDSRCSSGVAVDVLPCWDLYGYHLWLCLAGAAAKIARIGPLADGRQRSALGFAPLTWVPVIVPSPMTASAPPSAGALPGKYAAFSLLWNAVYGFGPRRDVRVAAASGLRQLVAGQMVRAVNGSKPAPVCAELAGVGNPHPGSVSDAEWQNFAQSVRTLANASTPAAPFAERLAQWIRWAQRATCNNVSKTEVPSNGTGTAVPVQPTNASQHQPTVGGPPRDLPAVQLLVVNRRENYRLLNPAAVAATVRSRLAAIVVAAAGVAESGGGAGVTSCTGDVLRAELRRPGVLVDVTEAVFETLPVPAQVRTAASADIMLGTHGNGLTWSAVMRPGGVLIEVWSMRQFNGNYLGFAGKSGLHFAAIEHAPPSADRGKSRTDVAVNLLLLRDAVDDSVAAALTACGERCAVAPSPTEAPVAVGATTTPPKATSLAPLWTQPRRAPGAFQCDPSVTSRTYESLSTADLRNGEFAETSACRRPSLFPGLAPAVFPAGATTPVMTAAAKAASLATLRRLVGDAVSAAKGGWGKVGVSKRHLATVLPVLNARSVEALVATSYDWLDLAHPIHRDCATSSTCRDPVNSTGAKELAQKCGKGASCISSSNARSTLRCLVGCLVLSRLSGCLAIDFASATDVDQARRRLAQTEVVEVAAASRGEEYIRSRQRAFFGTDPGAKASWNAAHPMDRYT